MIGIFGLTASIINWDLVFKGRTYNTQKIVGTANMWGRGYARFKFGISGIVCIIFGIIWFIIF
ncbi:hypothetical protein AGMMS50230_22390 [Spirochaetia bacterium]|nr:hypothetical protein AGMMS50230_22390 [Spirochaetia bacterium]